MKRVDLPQQTNKVTIAPNIKKESVRIDMYGNEIDPRTRQILKKVESNSEEK